MGYWGRIFYFLFAPFTLVVLSQLLPLGGMVFDIVTTLGIFLLDERIEALSIRGFSLSRLFKKKLRFRNYYQEHPPRNFLYYVFYPVLFPYWLFNKQARQEFALYRGYNLLSLSALLLSSVMQYFRFWWPDITYKHFLPSVFATLVLQLLIVMMFLMPVATTVVSYKLQGQSAKLRWFALAAVIGVALSLVGLAGTRTTRRPLIDADRTYMRELEHPAQALEAKKAALLAVQPMLASAKIERDGLILGAPQDKLRQALTVFFKPDEVVFFFLWTSPKDPTTVVLFSLKANRLGFWLALRPDGQWITDEQALPANALRDMVLAAKS